MPIHIEYTGFEQRIVRDGRPFVPSIYDGEGEVPAGFNVARIRLDASDQSLLQWQTSLLKAEQMTQKGMLVLWDLDFALLEGSLEDEARFLTLQLNMRHFVESIMPAWNEMTFGVSLHRGPFSHGMVEYVKMLAALLPDTILPFLFLDTTQVVEPAAYFRLTSLEIFGHLRLALKGVCAERYPYALPTLGWGHARSPLGFCAEQCMAPLAECRIEYALCLPEEGNGEMVGKAIRLLGERPFRAIPEGVLTQEWDGIEKLIIFPELLGAKGWRKIRGFIASGGEIINYPDDAASLQLPQTSPLSSQAALL